MKCSGSILLGCWQPGKVALLVDRAGNEARPFLMSFKGLSIISRTPVEALGVLGFSPVCVLSHSVVSDSL